MRKPILIAVLAVVAVLGGLALEGAMAAAQTTVEAAAMPPPDPVPTRNMTIDELITSIVRVVSDWRTTGWLAGLIALINLLINLLRLPVLARWLERQNLKWIKPAVAAVLGGLLTAFLAYQDGRGVGGAAVGGLLVGLSATGVHELFSAPRRAARRRYTLDPLGPRR